MKPGQTLSITDFSPFLQQIYYKKRHSSIFKIEGVALNLKMAILNADCLLN